MEKRDLSVAKLIHFRETDLCSSYPQNVYLSIFEVPGDSVAPPAFIPATRDIGLQQGSRSLTFVRGAGFHC